jgi:hypothetical protein
VISQPGIQQGTAETLAELVDVAARNYDVLSHDRVVRSVLREALRNNTVRLVDLGQRISPMHSGLFHGMVAQSDVLRSSRDALTNELRDADAQMNNLFAQQGVDPARIELLTIDAQGTQRGLELRGRELFRGLGDDNEITVYYYYRPQ